MAQVKLGINNCFALGRFPEPEEWIRVVKDELGLEYVQFCFDLLDPIIIDWELVEEKCRFIREKAEQKGIIIDTAVTGEVAHRFNLLLDPDPGMRRCYLRWYEKMIRAAHLLGARGSGIYMGTMSDKDWQAPARRDYLIDVLLEEIAYLSFIADRGGEEYLLWEPMSLPRELPSTIDETKKLLDRVNQRSHAPVKLCLDVGHGYYRSPDPKDQTAEGWLRELAHLSPSIHIQQTDRKGSRHWPFTKEYNALGVIEPQKVLEAIEQSGAEEVVLVFEFFFSAHALSDEIVLSSMKESAEYWQEALTKFYG
ncbi:MAG: hypothetical protein PWP04_435 [Candidatus Atribacteria bacterium]|nr:hypothetical protein [Candidatus Atribacteria bacterium]